ncbi:hypothetical protein Q31b_40920 [Novipirellula aureliae]|uniref:Uncharacterized protein n=1 Tax=Novipirellula aureliae TaxID=2527966 RepID=A0A5C6DU84_9BACT|nr:hypothetical protein Q31b_40920 [Novipirellula aureliae]
MSEFEGVTVFGCCVRDSVQEGAQCLKSLAITGHGHT